MSPPDFARLTKSPARSANYACSDFDTLDEKTEYDPEKRISVLQHSFSSSSYKSISHDDHSHHEFYKPAAHRSWVFALFLVALATCIGLLQYVVQTYPDQALVKALSPLSSTSTISTTSTASITSSISSLDRRYITIKRRAVVWIRQDDSSSSTTEISSDTTELSPDVTEPSTTTTTSDNSESTTSPAVDDAGSSNNSDSSESYDSCGGSECPTTVEPTVAATVFAADELYIGSNTIDTDLIVTPTTSPDNAAPTDAEAVETPGAPPTEAQLIADGPTSAAQADVLQADVVSANTAPTGAGAADIAPNTATATPLVTLAGAASVVSGSLLQSGTEIVGTVPQGATASVVSGSLIVSGTSILGTVDPDALKATSAGQLGVGALTLTDSAGRPTATVAYTGNVVFMGEDGKPTTVSYNGDIVLTDSNGVPTKTLSDAVVLTDSNGVPTQTLSFVDSLVLTDSNGVPTKTILYTGLATSTATAADIPAQQAPFTKYTYFAVLYLPNILGVLLQASWLIVFATFKVMEPFYELASPSGAPATSTLIADYLSTGLSASIFSRVVDGHYVLVLAGLVQFCLAMVVTLVSESMNVKPTDYCPRNGVLQPCDPAWVINTVLVRIVQVLLVACFSMVIMILVLNRKRVSGVYSDPSSIATMADLLVHKPLLHELRDIPATAGTNEIAHDLRDSRYMLGTFVDHGKERYGLVKLEDSGEASRSLGKISSVKSFQNRLSKLFDDVSMAVYKAAPFLPDFLCMALAIIIFSMVVAYLTINPSDPGLNASFNDWMWKSGGDFGPRAMMTGMAVVIGFLVKRKERYLRLSHPYMVLSKRPTLASEVITPGIRKDPFSSAYKALRTRDIGLSLMSSAAICSDILLIAAPEIPFTGSQTRNSYLVTTSLAIPLSLLIAIATAFIVWREWRSGNRHDECPETLAAGLMRLCASKFVEEKNMISLGPQGELFNGDDKDSQRARYEGANGQRRYIYGVMEGVDGVQRYMVEEDIYAPAILVDKRQS